MVTLAFIVSEKTLGQTDKKTYKQTNKRTNGGEKTIVAVRLQQTRGPLGKRESRTGSNCSSYRLSHGWFEIWLSFTSE